MRNSFTSNKNLWTLLLIQFYILINGPATAQENDLRELGSRLNEAKKLLTEDITKADSLATIILARSLKTGHDSLIAQTYYTLGVIHYYKGNYLTSTNFYDKALKTNLAKTDKHFAAALWNNQGVNYEFSSENEKAVEAYFKSLQIAEELKDSTGIFQSYINIGFLFIALKNHESAEEYLTKALNYFSRQEDFNHMGLCYHNLAALKENRGQTRESLEFYDKAIDHYRKAENHLELISAYYDKTTYLVDIKRFDEAKKHLKTLTTLGEESNNISKLGSIELLRGKFLLYGQKKYQEAADCFLKAEELCLKSNSKKRLTDIYKNLANVYVHTGEHMKHMEILEKFDTLLQQFYDEASSQKMAEFRTLYELKEKNRQEKILEQEIAYQKRMLVFIISFLLLSFVTVFLLLYYNRKIKKEHQALFQRNMELKKEMEKEQTLLEKQSEDHTGDDYSLIFFRELYQRLKTYMHRQKPFLDPNLKLSDLALPLGTNEKYLSKAILNCHKTGFYEFIAQYRINEAKKIFTTEYRTTLLMKEVASRTGFSNPSTFQRKFKEMTGMTPYTFLQIARSKSYQSEK